MDVLGDGLAQVLGDLAITMQDQEDTESTLRTVVEAAVDIVPGARWGGIALLDGHTVDPRVPSDPLVAKLDLIQNEVAGGPCLTSLREHRTVLIEDMAADARWPEFSSAAVELGARSLLSFQLSVLRKSLGVLNLYGGESGVFSDDSLYIGGIVAQHASVALFGAEAEAQFEAALTSRDVIGQAKGIIMERLGVDADTAFILLTKLSQDSNTKVVEIAGRVVDSVLSVPDAQKRSRSDAACAVPG